MRQNEVYNWCMTISLVCCMYWWFKVGHIEKQKIPLLFQPNGSSKTPTMDNWRGPEIFASSCLDHIKVGHPALQSSAHRTYQSLQLVALSSLLQPVLDHLTSAIVHANRPPSSELMLDTFQTYCAPSKPACLLE